MTTSDRAHPRAAVLDPGLDRDLRPTREAVARHLGAMPCASYELRLIHGVNRRPFPGQRIWPSSRILHPATLRFLRIRNHEGFDIYLRPFAGPDNAGYVLLDLDRPGAGVLDQMRTERCQPCLVLETSPGRLQAWVRLSAEPVPPTRATELAKALARRFRADPASADWRHLGRLAGFTNRKPARRQPDGLAPWVRVVSARPRLACQAPRLAATTGPVQGAPELCAIPSPDNRGDIAAIAPETVPAPPPAQAFGARSIYTEWMRRLRILERFPAPDWSIADLWIAEQLLRAAMSPAEAAHALAMGSPGFPRGHPHPEDYLRRTLAVAARRANAPR